MRQLMKLFRTLARSRGINRAGRRSWAGTSPAPTTLRNGRLKVNGRRREIVGAGLVPAHRRRLAPVIQVAAGWMACGTVALSLVIAGCSHPKVATPAPVVSQERLVIAYNGEGGKTALEILKAHASVRTSTSSLGELVEEINGIRSTEHEHLLFFVNGEMSKVGAGGYITKPGDRIEWKLVIHGGKK